MSDLSITEIETTGSGTIPVGAWAIYVMNTGAGTATCSSVVDVGKIPPGAAKNFEVIGRPYPTMFYNGNGNTIYITIIR